MSQFDFPTINPDTKSGSVLASDLNNWANAIESGHKGASRPVYVQAGMQWIKEVSATAWEIYRFDGTDDILEGTLNPTANTYTPNLGGTSLSSLATATVGNGVKISSGALVTKISPSSVNSNITVTSSHRANALLCTGAVTLALTAASTLGSDFFCYISALSGNVIVDPAGAETVDGATTVTLIPGESATLICDGVGFRLINRGSIKDIISLTADTVADGADSIAFYDTSAGLLKRITKTNFLAGIGGSGSYTAFTTPGTTSWAKPTAGNVVLAEVWGAGGSGARRSDFAGGGGGGGAYTARFLRMSLLAASEAVVVGAGGAAVTGSNANGNAGGLSSFSSGANATVGGGGGGGGQANGNAGGGGGGGGEGSSGATGSSGTGSATGGSGGFFGGGSGGAVVSGVVSAGEDSNGGNAGGGGGAGHSAAGGSNGGRAAYGGGGGGGAGQLGSAGSGGASVYGGNGGNGTNASGGTAVSGSAPGGGGGAARGTSGAGARGEVRVWVF